MLLIDVCNGIYWSNVPEQRPGDAAKQGSAASAGDVCSSSGLACYLHFMYSNCDIYKHTHTHTQTLSFSLTLMLLLFPSLFPFLSHLHLSLSRSAAKTLTHVPLSTVIDIHLCVSRPTPFLPPPPLAPSTGCFSCSARMNLIAQMCVKLYFCIRRQSHISQAEQQQRSSSARHGRHGGQHQLCSQCSLWLCQLLLLWFSQPYS